MKKKKTLHKYRFRRTNTFKNMKLTFMETHCLLLHVSAALEEHAINRPARMTLKEAAVVLSNFRSELKRAFRIKDVEYTKLNKGLLDGTLAIPSQSPFWERYGAEIKRRLHKKRIELPKK